MSRFEEFEAEREHVSHAANAAWQILNQLHFVGNLRAVEEQIGEGVKEALKELFGSGLIYFADETTLFPFRKDKPPVTVMKNKGVVPSGREKLPFHIQVLSEIQVRDLHGEHKVTAETLIDFLGDEVLAALHQLFQSGFILINGCSAAPKEDRIISGDDEVTLTRPLDDRKAASNRGQQITQRVRLSAPLRGRIQKRNS